MALPARRLIQRASLLGLSVALAAPAFAATPSEDPARPLGILLSPKVINDKSEPGPVVRPTEEPPPLGVLIAPNPTPPAAGTGVPAASRPVPGLAPAAPPGSAPRATPPSASEDRPLGILMSAPPRLSQPAIQSKPPVSAPAVRAPNTVTAPPQWQTAGQSDSLPLGTLLAPDPVNVPGIDRTAVSVPAAPVIAPASSQPAAPAWQTSGRTRDRPLGTLFTPNKPLDLPVVQSPAEPALSQPPSELTPVEKEEAANFSADEMSFDRNTGIVTASGDVEIHHRERSLRADKVTYNRQNGIIQASGNVVMSEPSGERIFGDLVEVSGDLKDGIIKNIGIILADRSRIAGAGGQRTAGLVSDMHKAVYSPCELCKEDPTKPPVWQIKAVRVTHDQSQNVVEYRDAWIEFFGYPVLYTPYFRHPDPSVKRKSGFLFPRIGNSSDLGTIIQTPYYWNISPHEDATFTPILMTDAYPIMSLEHRKKMLKGEIETKASITKSDTDDEATDTEKGKFGTRGHIDAFGKFEIDDNWRWGFDAYRATDDTYLRRFNFSSPGSLNSRLYTESFRQRSYFSASTHAFQGLEATDDQNTTPFVLPLVDFNHVGEKDRFGGTTDFDFNLLALTRGRGTDTRRMSIKSKWQRPVVGSVGDIYTLSLGMNAGLYHANSLSRTDSTTEYSGFGYRALPEASVDWRMPFVKSMGNVSQTLEPIAKITMSPHGGNPTNIPNEDSNELEFDDTNLFSTNRFSGLDRVEGGLRVAYGVKWGVFGAGGGSTRVFIGQSWRPKTDDTFAAGSGLEDNFSDVVARLDVKPGEHLDLTYRTRFSPDNFAPNRNEIKVNAGVPAFNVNANYLFLDRQVNSEFGGREEVSFSATSKLNRLWRTSFSGVRDMASNEFRTLGLNFVYEDECVVLTTSATRTFFEDRDVEPTDSITFRLLLKTLGEVHSGFSQSQ